MPLRVVDFAPAFTVPIAIDSCTADLHVGQLANGGAGGKPAAILLGCGGNASPSATFEGSVVTTLIDFDGLPPLVKIGG